VKEIIGMMNITPVPQTPAFVKGVINLRGKVIPVVDLRLRFALEAAAYTERTCIIVVEVAGATPKKPATASSRSPTCGRPSPGRSPPGSRRGRW